MKGYGLSIFILLFLISCNENLNQKEENKEFKMQFLSRHDEFFDSLPRFFVNIKSIEEYNGEIFFSDNAARKIFVTDSDLNYKREFLTAGEGPNEIKAVGGISISEEGNIFVPDYLSRKFLITDNQGVVKEIVSPVAHTITDEKFIVNQDFITFIDRRSKSIIKVDRETNKVESIEIPTELFESCSNSQTPRMSIFSKGKNYIILTHTLCPIIALVSEYGELISLLDFSNIPFFKPSKELQTELNAKGQGQSVVFFHGAEVLGDNLFAIGGQRDKIGNVSFNHFLIFELTDQEFDLKQVVHLEKSNWYSTFKILPSLKKIIFFDSGTNNKYIDVYEF